MTQRAWGTGDLARLGFSTDQRTVAQLEKIISQLPDEESVDVMVAQLSSAALPDQALSGLVEVLESDDGELASDLLDAEQAGATDRLIKVLGGSIGLQRHIRAHPDAVSACLVDARRATADEIRQRIADAIGLTPSGLGELAVDDEKAADRLRLANKWELTRIAARDLSAADPTQLMAEVAAELSDLADAVLAGALSVARAEVVEHELAQLAVIGLGKAGAQELNYLSDVDVLFVAEPKADADPQKAIAAATKLAAALTRICSAHSPAGSIWTLDAALRPEGNAGPLVRTLAGHRSYYEKWAKNWEFQAMLKARPMAGDQALGVEFCDMVADGVWSVGAQSHFIPEIQAMRRRVIENIPRAERDREIKLGPGGLRDVEFSVQLLQLVHGRSDERLRQRATLPALQALVDASYIGREDGATLAQAYRFERCLEHREQLWRLKRTHLMPDDPAELRRLARQMGGNDAQQLEETWRETTRTVRRLQQRIFYSPLLVAVAKLPNEQVQLSEEAVADRMRALGFQDPAAALRHIAALTSGMTRRAAIQRQLMPAMLEWLSQGPNPDLGMLSFRQLSDELGESSWYLRTLRDEGVAAERLALGLSSSRYLPELLRRSPSSVQFLTDREQLQPRSADELVESMRQVVDRHEAVADQVSAVQALRRRELFRIAAADLLGEMQLDQIGEALSQLANATIEAALTMARRAEHNEHPELDIDQLPIALISMGSWGGREMSYSSDADALFVVGDDTSPEQLAAANRIAGNVANLVRDFGPAPALTIDAGLRPEGKNGPLVRTLASYRNYYTSWAKTWEVQALLRAEYGAGDQRLAAQFLADIADFRWPENGLTSQQLADIHKMKSRVEKERAGLTADRDVKLGPGGLLDVEWTVQLLQLQHAGEHPTLQVSGAMPALDAAEELGLISSGDARVLREAWRLAAEIRNKSMIVRNKATDLLPVDPRETAAIARLMGYQDAASAQLLERHQRARRLATKVVDKIFWGRT